MRKNKLFTFGAAFLVAGLLIGLQFGSAVSGDRSQRALDKLEDAFMIVSQRYVEHVDSADLAEHAITGMLRELDPHSVYLSAERMKQVREDFNAAFEGIGISYELIAGTDEGQDTLAVLSVIPGGPSEEVGLMSGDRIVTVDGESAIGYTHEDVRSNLKGPRGTQVAVDVLRPGVTDPLHFAITRDQIPIYTVDASYMMGDGVGYIKVNRFARTTYAEFMRALTQLKGAGMERLVLDLRGNAGGFMDMAIRISDEFLTEGETIVSQRGRTPDTNESYEATAGGAWEHQPVILLVDRQSASASEIVAGALQDHDRALIVGERTFGKGLVQKQFLLDDGSALRVTISRYYTPTGRLIQTPYENGDRETYYKDKFEQLDAEATLTPDEIRRHMPDSLRFTTDAGRTVYGGGGILPDYIVPPDSANPYVRAVLGRNIDRLYVRKWIDREGARWRETWGDRRDAFIADFEVTHADLDAFIAFAGEQGVGGEDEAYSADDVADARALLKTILRGRIGVRLFDRSVWYPVFNETDPLVTQAQALWATADELAGQYAEAH